MPLIYAIEQNEVHTIIGVAFLWNYNRVVLNVNPFKKLGRNFGPNQRKNNNVWSAELPTQS